MIKTIFQLGILFFILLFFSCAEHKKAIEKDNPIETSMLWKMEGEGIQTSFIFGTFHLIPQSDFELSEALKESFSQCEQVVMELDMDDPNLQKESMQYMMMSNGKGLGDYLSQQQYKSLDSLLDDYSGMGLKFFEQMKPLVLSTFMLVGLMDEEMASYEKSLMEMAKESNVEILGLETVKEQMNAMDNIPIEEQVEELMLFVSSQDSLKRIFNEMIRLYKKPDMDSLVVLFNDYYDEPDFMDNLLYQRNENWKTRIPSMCAKKATFFAVGAGHLGGEQGIIQLLREQGYTLTPVN
jgi:uncharacterized protein YbaP (TraB family)